MDALLRSFLIFSRLIPVYPTCQSDGNLSMNIKIDHIACWTEDIDITCAFYAKYFEAVINPPYHNPIKRNTTRFLDFPGGGKLELMHNPNIKSIFPKTGEGHIGFIHLSFSVGSREAVDGLTQRLLVDGYAVVDGPRLTGDGYYESSVLDPDGNRVEITL
jgi:lactoylglutathione lyase